MLLRDQVFLLQQVDQVLFIAGQFIDESVGLFALQEFPGRVDHRDIELHELDVLDEQVAIQLPVSG